MPARSFLALPLVFSALVFLAWSYPNKIIRALLVALAVACSFQFMVLDNRLAFADYLCWQADRELAGRIQKAVDEISDQLPRKDPDEKWAMETVGYYSRPETPLYIRSDLVGASFFAWDHGWPGGRIVAFMKTMGLNDYRSPTMAQKQSVIADAIKMPSWPAHGCVKVVHGVIVVKLSDYTSEQLQGLSGMGADVSGVPIQAVLPMGTSFEFFKNKQFSHGKMIYRLDPSGKNYTTRNLKEIKAGADDFQLASLNDDPMIVLPALPVAEDDFFLLKVEIVVEKETETEIYYRTEKDAEFKEGQRVGLSLSKGRNELHYLVPGRLLRSPLRVDPVTDKEKLTIKDISIYEWKEAKPSDV